MIIYNFFNAKNDKKIVYGFVRKNNKITILYSEGENFYEFDNIHKIGNTTFAQQKQILVIVQENNYYIDYGCILSNVPDKFAEIKNPTCVY